MPSARAASLATLSLALLGPLALPACSGSDEQSTPAPAGTTVAADGLAACVTETGTATAGDLTVEILAPVTCDASQSGIIGVTNQGELSCSSNYNSIVSGNRLAFTSESGFGGEVGSWGPIAESQPDPVGVIEYPPGTRRWPFVLPVGLTGELNWSIAAIDCGADEYAVGVDFVAG
jgi:hypothetical protein